MERHFDQLLGDLKGELLKMGGAVEESIAQAIQALVERDDGLAQRVIEGGKQIDQWEVKIEAVCITLMATHQPVASDLRRIIAAMHVAGELERMADLAEAIDGTNRGRYGLMLNRLRPTNPTEISL
jgi:phosphate transport system protein